MKAQFYVVYEEYSEFNQFEGEWNLYIKEFSTLAEADEWLRTSREADDARRCKRKLIGPLTEAKKKA